MTGLDELIQMLRDMDGPDPECLAVRDMRFKAGDGREDARTIVLTLQKDTKDGTETVGLEFLTEAGRDGVWMTKGTARDLGNMLLEYAGPQSEDERDESDAYTLKAVIEALQRKDVPQDFITDMASELGLL